VPSHFSLKNSFLLSLHFEVAINLIGNEHELIAPWLAQLGERRSAERKVAGFKPRPNQHSGSLNNGPESAAFAMTSANG